MSDVFFSNQTRHDVTSYIRVAHNKSVFDTKLLQVRN